PGRRASRRGRRRAARGRRGGGGARARRARPHRGREGVAPGVARAAAGGGPPARSTIEPMLVADIATLLIPLWILLFLLLLLGTLALLGRIQNGRYLRPILTTLMKVPILKKWIEKASNAAIERSNP